MTIIRNSLLAAAIAIGIAGTAQAQTLGDIAMWNMQQDQAFYGWVGNSVQTMYDQVQLYRQQTGDYTTPFSVLTGSQHITPGSVSQSISGADAYTLQLMQQSQAYRDMVFGNNSANWSNYFRGNY